MRSIFATLLLLGAFSGSLFADDHGDSALAATPIGVDGTLVDACIEEPEDLDCFLFVAVAGRTYRILTSHQSAEMEAVAYLLASDGRTILAVAASAEDGTGAQIRWTCPADGTYFAMVRHVQAVAGTGCYALSISLELLDDHGDDAFFASPLSVGGDAMPGFLETADDVDAFLAPIDRGYDYVIELVRTSGTAQLELELSGDVEGARHVSVSEIERIEVAGRSAGSLFLLVGSPEGEPPIGYEIRIERAGYADDHGGEAATATALDTHGPAVVGAIEVMGDADWFGLNVRAGGEYSFVLSSDVGLSLRLALRAGHGEIVLQGASTANGAPASLEWTAPSTGSFYLEVSALNGIGTYTLTATSTLQLESVGRFNPSGYSLDVSARGGLAYLIVGVKGLSIVDVSDPSDPHEVGSNSTRGYAEAIALYDSFALIANRGDGLTIIDVSDPTRPVETGYLETPGWAQDVAVEGNIAVIADQRTGIHVVRLSSSGTATLLATHATGGHAGAVALVDDIAYVAIGDAGLEIVDLSEPEAPSLLGSIETSGDARDVAILDSIVYVAAGYRGVRIVSTADPSAPEEVGWFGTSDEAVALHLAGHHLYVAERTGVSVYSIADPASPERIAAIETPGEAVAVTVTDGLVLIADRQEGLQIARVLP
jgi:hypothetical protein